MATLKVKTGGLTTVVYSVAAYPSGTSQAIYSDAAMTSAVTLPTTITADTTYYLVQGEVTVTLKQADGTTLFSGKVDAIEPIGALIDVGPESSVVRTAAQVDVSNVGAIISTAIATQHTADIGMFAGIARSRMGNQAVYWGDSLTAGSDGGGTIGSSHGEAWPVYLGLVSQQGIRYVRNAGVAGENSTSILARFDTDVLPYNPTVVFILDGTNDLNSANDAETAFATWKANKASQVAKCRAIGAIPVLLTMPPNSTGSPINRREEIIRWNGWLRRYAQANGIDLVDLYTLVVDPSNGNWLSAYNNDGTHWNAAGMLAVANRIWTQVGPRLPLTTAPLLCSDAIDEANLITNGIFNGLTGTSLPTGWGDNAGTPTGSALSYVTDTAVPGKLFTITSTASSALRQIGRPYNFAATTMPSVSAGATSFSLSVNPYSAGTLFIGTPGSSTYEIVKVSSVSGGGPFTVNITRALRHAHSAGEPVVVNGQPGDTLAFSGLVTSDGGAWFRARLDYTPSTGSPKVLDQITQPLTRATWYSECVVPASVTQVSVNLDINAGTSVIGFGQLGLYNLTRMES